MSTGTTIFDGDVDPDAQNSMIRIRIQVNKITKLISHHPIKVKKKYLIFKSEPKP